MMTSANEILMTIGIWILVTLQLQHELSFFNAILIIVAVIFLNLWDTQ